MIIDNCSYKVNRALFSLLSNKRKPQGGVLKSAVIMIDMVSVQNQLASLCCVLGKDTLRHFLLLGGLGKQF